MVERPLSMREVPGSIPGFSNHRSSVSATLKQHFLTVLTRGILSHTPVQFN